MTESRRWWIRGVLTGLAVVALISVAWGRRGDLTTLAEVHFGSVVLVALLVAVAHWLNALEFAILYRAVGAPVRIKENWLLFTAGQLLNYLPAQLGTLFRFRYLRTVHGLSYSRATSSHGANLVLTVMATGILGLSGTLLLVATRDEKLPLVLLVVFSGMLVIALLAAIAPLPTVRASGKVSRGWVGFQSGWAELQRQRTRALIILGIEFLKYLLVAVRLQLGFGWLGYNEPYIFFLVLASTMGLATLVALTPAALGIRELSVSATAVALGRSFGEGVLGATVDRAALFAVTLVLGSVGLVASERRIRQSQGPADVGIGPPPLGNGQDLTE